MTEMPDEPRKPPTKTAVIVGLSAVVVAVVALVAIAVVLVAGGGGKDQPATASSSSSRASLPPLPSSSSAPAQAPPANGQLPPFTPAAGLGSDCQYLPSRESASRPVDPPKAGKVGTAEVSAQLSTNQGAIGLTLDGTQSPCTVNSFVSLAKQGFFSDTSCHRLTTSPMLHVLQCGDPDGTGTGGPGYEFADEYPTDQYPPYDSGLQRPVTYPRGTLAMANAGPNTNGSQFFLVYQDSQLPPAYTVFGTIDDAGLATLDKIARAGLTPGPRGGDDGAPANEVRITSVRVG